MTTPTSITAPPSVVHLLLEAARRCPTREALVCGDTRLTYREYLHCAVRLANEFIGLGAAGERVALLLGNSAELCIAMFAVHLARAQAVPLNPAYTPSELRPQLADAAPLVMLVETDNAARDTVLAGELGIPHLITCGAGGRRLAESPPPAITLNGPLPDAHELATLQFTGGTTGRSKGANLTHGAIALNLAQRAAVLPAREDCERILCVMPLFHVYAIHMCMHNAVHCRGTLVIMPRFQPDELIALLPRERITIFAGSPTLFTSLLNYPPFATADFSHLAVTYSGASALPPEVLDAWEKLTGAPPIEGYGQTEAGPVASFNPLYGTRKVSSVGVALPGVEIEIVDLEHGNDVLPAGTPGEIRVRGPQIMRDYRNRPEETAATIRRGWLYTGDVGEFDAEGYLYIRGRKKEMIIVSGYNVYPREVEEVLLGAPGVADCAVLGKPDPRHGELPVAFVVPRDGEAVTIESLHAHCAERLVRYKQPAEYRLVASLPKTSVGKLDRVALKLGSGIPSQVR
ncbi:MAG: class I adenylate-forming enzyme family protein [Gammaproteobacteria bacterium]